ncbi:unnamed protein product [Lampetra planeri]
MSSMGPATRLITENRVDLQDILTTREVTAKSSSQGGYEAASHLILRLLQKDHRISVAVWEALWKTRSTYQRLHDLLQDVFPNRA